MDIDVDFSNRERVIDYLLNKYGEDRVCQIINFNYYTPLVAIEDIGKILGFQYKEMRKLSAKFNDNDFNKCIEKNKSFLEQNMQYDQLIDIAKHISGRVKTVSCHAGGVGIVNTDMSDYMAMKLGSKGEHVIQVDKKIIESIGIIKFDILGVQTLSMLKEIKEDLNLSNWDLDVNNNEFTSNEKAYDLLTKGLTNGVFQTESSGMCDLLKRLKPKNMNDISAVLALYRPDTMGSLNDYIDAKNGDKVVHNIHSDMDDILKETYNCLLYQEQMMNIVRVFGGRTYGGADLFRKAIGKKDEKLVKQEAEKLYYEILDNNYEENVARWLSDYMESKGGYLFNQSHSYSYAVLTLQTAYLKANYPLYFFKALFNLNINVAGMLNKYILDAKNFNIVVNKPHINKSDVKFSIIDNEIIFGLCGIADIGEDLARRIVEERERNGKYTGIDNLLSRVELTKKQVIMLIKSGAIPCKNKRKSMQKYIDKLYTPNKFSCSSKLPSYKDLLLKWDIDYEAYRNGSGRYDYDKEKLYELYKEKAYQAYLEKEENRITKHRNENLKYFEDEEFWEFEALQIFVSDNPFDKAYEYLEKPFTEVSIGDKCVIPGVIAKVIKKKDKNKNAYAYINLYSSEGLIEVLVFATLYKQFEEYIRKGNKITILCKKDGDYRTICEDIRSYESWISWISQRKIKNQSK